MSTALGNVAPRPWTNRRCRPRPGVGAGAYTAAGNRYSLLRTESALETLSPGPASTNSSCTLPSLTIIA